MADLQAVIAKCKHMKSYSCGYDVSIFVDEDTAAIYTCGICNKICKDAVEIAEKQDKNHAKDDEIKALNAKEGSLFCEQCVQQFNLSPHAFVSSKFLRNRINNLTVCCPHSIEVIEPHATNGYHRDSIEGETYCEWTGALSDLSYHVDHECSSKPLTKCPFDCPHSKTETHITRHHLKQHQTQHIDILLSMVQNLTNQLSQAHNQINDLQNQITTNKNTRNAEMSSLKRQISKLYSQNCTTIPPPPPPSIERRNTRNIYSSYVTRPIGCIASDFGFQIDHPNVCVIANGRTAICMATKDTVIGFGPCLLENKPSHKTRISRKSSIDDIFADPSMLNMSDDEDIFITPMEESHSGKKRRCSNPFRKKKKQKHKERRCVSVMNVLDLKKKNPKIHNQFAMNVNRLNGLNSSDSDKVSRWQCYVFVEDCDEECGNIGIAMMNDGNNKMCTTLYKNGDYIDANGQKINKKEFSFERGNVVCVCIEWNKRECNVTVSNVDSHKSVVMNGLGMFVKFGFVLNSARITVIEQYWQ